MKKPIDTYLKIQGLKQHKHKPRLFFRVWYGNTCVDEGANYALLASKYKGWGVKIKGVY